MTRIVFYVLDDDPATNDALRFVCRYADKAWRNRQRCLINTTNNATAERLDTLMWTFRDQSFVPHQNVLNGHSADDDAGTAVLIGDSRQVTDSRDVLINLEPDVPVDLTPYVTIVELVHGGDATRARARQRFRQYRELGYTPESHTIDEQRRDNG